MADEIVAVYRAEVEQYKKAVDELVGKVDKLDKEQRTATESAKGMGVQMRGLGREIVAAFGVTVGVAGFVTVLKGAITTAKNFEAQMSKVKGVSGATEQQMRSLEKTAKQLGASTMFTATQVGQLQEEYAKLGFTTDQIQQATAATLDLAAATGSTLAQAAEVAGATVQGFGLDASETIRVTDVMSMSFNKSALDIERFRESIKLVAPIARAANIDLETTTALLSVLANAGLSGSIAGTALKNLLSKLSDENSDLSKQLGFAVKNSDDLFIAFEKLAKMNIDLTAATELTDERSKAAFITLFNGIGTVKDLDSAYRNAGGSTKILADIMKDNLQGAVTELSSAWEGLILEVTKTEALKKATRALTEMLQALTESAGTSNAPMQKASEDLATFKESLMGLSGLGILKAINDTRDALADAENSLSDLRKENNMFSRNEDFKKAVEAQQITVDTLRQKFEAARKALKDFRDRQTELGGELAPTADEIERMTQALDEMAEVVPPPVRSIEFLSSQLKTLKDSLQKAEIGSDGFWNVLFKIEKKLKELRDAEAMTKLIEDLTPDADDTSEQDAKIYSEVQAEIDKYNRLKKEREDFNAYLSKKNKEEIRDELDKINEIEQANKDAQENEKERREENFANAEMFFGQLLEINNAITSAIMAGHEQEQISLDNQLEAGQISREQYDQRRRQLEREKAQDAKTAAIFNAVIGTALAVVNALAVGPPQGYILAAISAALGAVEIGVISAQPLPQFATGVIGLQGAGTETSDSIHARLSKGESVMTAAETRKYRPILEGIRRGTLDEIIRENYVRPAIDAALLNGFADIGQSADLNGITAKLSDHNIIAAMDRNRTATVYGLKMLADKLDKRTPKRGGYA